MLQIDLENIYHSEAGKAETVELKSQLEMPSGITSSKVSVDGRLQITKIKDGLELDFTAKSSFPVACDRCLDTFDFNSVCSFDQFLENDQIIHLKDYEYDIESLLIENILLKIPIKRLCNVNCKGLCQNCGSNLNLKNCDCEKENKPNPFKILKKEVHGPTKEKDIKS